MSDFFEEENHYCCKVAFGVRAPVSSLGIAPPCQALVKISSLSVKEKAIVDSKGQEEVLLSLKNGCRLFIVEPL